MEHLIPLPIYVIGYFLLILLLSRWANRVATQMPSWMDKDWAHQATYFLATRKVAMNPVEMQKVDESTLDVEPEPKKVWWSPKSNDPAKDGGWKYWVPFWGSARLKDWRGLWSDLCVTFYTAAGLAVFLSAIQSSPELMNSLNNGTISTTPFIFHLVWLPILALLLQTLSTIDYKTNFLPDVLTQVVLWLGITASAMHFTVIPTITAVQGAIFGYGLLWIIAKTFKMIRGKDGMGGGDMKLAAATGAWLGTGLLMTTLGIAVFLGLIFSIYNTFIRKRGQYSAFGPAIATASIWTFIFLPILVTST